MTGTPLYFVYVYWLVISNDIQNDKSQYFEQTLPNNYESWFEKFWTIPNDLGTITKRFETIRSNIVEDLNKDNLLVLTFSNNKLSEYT